MDNRCPPDIEAQFTDLLKRHEIEEELIDQLNQIYLPVAEWIASQPQPCVIGINGAPGAGKSTLSLILALLLEQQHSLRVATLSIDDLYKNRSERQQMAQNIHPLFVTRGVPGSHNVALGCDTIRSLLADEPTAIPRFDKAQDEPLPQAEWPLFEGAADVVLFEGWCVGATAQHEDELRVPLNRLEEQEDYSGEWRSHVNHQLKQEYPRLFELIDTLIMLEIPAYEKVLEWRTLQESRLRTPAGARATGMDEQELQRFIMHFERLTRHILQEMPGRADIVLKLNRQHQIEEITIR